MLSDGIVQDVARDWSGGCARTWCVCVCNVNVEVEQLFRGGNFSMCARVGSAGFGRLLKNPTRGV